MESDKPFDCLKMKDEIQERLREEWQELTDEKKLVIASAGTWKHQTSRSLAGGGKSGSAIGSRPTGEVERSDGRSGLERRRERIAAFYEKRAIDYERVGREQAPAVRMERRPVSSS